MFESIMVGGGRLTQDYGCTWYQREWSCPGKGCQPGQRWHAGIDVGARVGTPLLAVGYGRVFAIGDGPSCSGWPGRGPGACFGPSAVGIRSGPVDIWYGHCSAPLIHCGDLVVPGQQIAYSGTLGCSTGGHLHFEVQRNNAINGCAALNPWPYVTSWPGLAPGGKPSAILGLTALGGAALVVFGLRGRTSPSSK